MQFVRLYSNFEQFCAKPPHYGTLTMSVDLTIEASTSQCSLSCTGLHLSIVTTTLTTTTTNTITTTTGWLGSVVVRASGLVIETS